MKKVLFTIKDKTLAVDGDMIYFTKFVVRMEGNTLYNVYLKNTEEILVKKLRGSWSDIENYLVKRNNLLDDHIDYIMYIAERGMDTYECVKAFSV